MLNLRLVIDTNVVVSAALKPEAFERVPLILAANKAGTALRFRTNP